MIAKTFLPVFLIILLLAVVVLLPEAGHSVPSFARQTELPCADCHTVFPELNSFGRLFKLNGYTLSSEQEIESKGTNQQASLKIPKIPPFSAMLQASYTHLKKTQPGTQNGNVSFPQQFSFFFAGQISPNLGGFVQLTWDDQSTAFDIDLLDVRYSHTFNISDKDLVFGLTLNNTPTVQDLWNSTPIWGYPYSASPIAPAPGAAPLLSGGLESFEQRFAGLGAYAMYDNMIYGELAGYRSTSHGEGGGPPDTNSANTTKNFAPYWRVVLQHQWPELYVSVGGYGFSGHFFPTGISGATDRFADIAADAQAMASLGPGTLTVHATGVHETRNFDATYPNGGTEHPTGKLNMIRADANYYFGQRYGISVGYFNISGDADTLAYAPAPISGFSGGNPGSSGVILELDYLPWMNVKLALQYTIYNKFNGADLNYDGNGRNASDNNTLYLLAWLAM